MYIQMKTDTNPMTHQVMANDKKTELVRIQFYNQANQLTVDQRTRIITAIARFVKENINIESEIEI